MPRLFTTLSCFCQQVGGTASPPCKNAWRVPRCKSLRRGCRASYITDWLYRSKTYLQNPLSTGCTFSIHAPTWGATNLAQAQNAVNKLFQSTRPRGARQKARRDEINARRVSIHAPTWGATAAAKADNLTAFVSIHAPTWGATSISERQEIEQCSFNPRVHVGRDNPAASLLSADRCFNPRAHVGRDSEV